MSINITALYVLKFMAFVCKYMDYQVPIPFTFYKQYNTKK